MSEPEDNGKGNLFLQLVLTLQTSAMQHLGKIASPFTGKMERDLGSARAAIDMLAMLSDKTKGNLTDVENKIVDRVIYELQMNYVDEANKPEEDEPEEAKPEEGEPEKGGEQSEEQATEPPSSDQESAGKD